MTKITYINKQVGCHCAKNKFEVKTLYQIQIKIIFW